MSALKIVTERMGQQIQQWETAVDHRAIFLTCYKQMTENMLIGLDEGAFQDAVWVGELLNHFADYYFVALAAYDTASSSTPVIWRQVHDMARHPETHVLQNLFLGVNAHINYDLVLTLVDLLQDGWAQLSPPQRELRYHDYCVVNDIIGRTIDTVQDEVVERWSPAMDVVDKTMGRLDEWLVLRLISNWREHVWQQAVRMMELPDEQTTLRQQVEMETRQRADAVLLKNGWKSLGLLLHEI
ncbi:MAG: hypothetical protein H6669_09355 [Ardenticatenaceae bacterium]|nr:hypothetical protein [Ardenticatenaceae bacterium]